MFNFCLDFKYNAFQNATTGLCCFLSVNQIGQVRFKTSVYTKLVFFSCTHSFMKTEIKLWFLFEHCLVYQHFTLSFSIKSINEKYLFQMSLLGVLAKSSILIILKLFSFFPKELTAWNFSIIPTFEFKVNNEILCNNATVISNKRHLYFFILGANFIQIFQ